MAYKINTDNFKIPDLEELKKQKSSISAGLKNRYNTSLTSWNYQKIALDNVLVKIGDKFSLKNGEILIGKDVTMIKASAHLTFNPSMITDYSLRIQKNGEQIYSSSESYGRNNSSSYDNVAISDSIIPVEAGDTIGLYFMTGGNTTTQILEMSQLTIEEC